MYKYTRTNICTVCTLYMYNDNYRYIHVYYLFSLCALKVCGSSILILFISFNVFVVLYSFIIYSLLGIDKLVSYTFNIHILLCIFQPTDWIYTNDTFPLPVGIGRLTVYV